jgi:glycerol-3-phosphate acyltransferase PlsY
VFIFYMKMVTPYLLTACMGYFLGAFPTGYIVGRLWKGIDIREYGSGRTGGANILRAVGALPAAITALGDVGKGVVAVLVARALWHNEAAAGLAALAALMGHDWSLFLGWHGGAGIGTTFGGLLILEPVTALVVALLGLLVAVISRYVSLGSLTFALLMPLALLGQRLWLQGSWEHLVYGILAGGIIIFAHRPNIDRLLKGTERRIGEAGKRRSP